MRYLIIILVLWSGSAVAQKHKPAKPVLQKMDTSSVPGAHLAVPVQDVTPPPTGGWVATGKIRVDTMWMKIDSMRGNYHFESKKFQGLVQMKEMYYKQAPGGLPGSSLPYWRPFGDLYTLDHKLLPPHTTTQVDQTPP